MADLDSVEIKARCLCRSNKLSWKLPKSSLPLDAGICCCDSCRHGTGTLGFPGCTWPLPIPDLPNCSKAPFSPRADVYFCKKCGTLMFLHRRTADWVGLALGVLEDPSRCKLSMHLCLADTKDGGMSVWLDSLNGTQLKKYATADLQSEFEAVTTKAGDGNLKASCRCGGAQFEITRPMEQPEGEATEAGEKSTSKGPQRLRNGRHTAAMCVCDSCRLSTGCDIVAWAFIPDINLLHDNKPLHDPPLFGAIKHYASSENTDRYFCGKCGATIFLRSKMRPNLLNVAVGVLHDESGARAEDWLCWKTSAGPENAADGLKRDLLTKDLTKQMIAWRN